MSLFLATLRLSPSLCEARFPDPESWWETGDARFTFSSAAQTVSSKTPRERRVLKCQLRLWACDLGLTLQTLPTLDQATSLAGAGGPLSKVPGAEERSQFQLGGRSKWRPQTHRGDGGSHPGLVHYEMFLGGSDVSQPDSQIFQFFQLLSILSVDFCLCSRFLLRALTCRTWMFTCEGQGLPF